MKRIFFLFLLCICYNVFSIDIYYTENADPISDARNAINRQQFQFMAISEFETTLPGIEEEQSFSPHLDSSIFQNYKMIEGTSDFIESYNDDRLNHIAKLYALYYNQAILAHLRFYETVDPSFLHDKAQFQRFHKEFYIVYLRYVDGEYNLCLNAKGNAGLINEICCDYTPKDTEIFSEIERRYQRIHCVLNKYDWTGLIDPQKTPKPFVIEISSVNSKNIFSIPSSIKQKLGFLPSEIASFVFYTKFGVLSGYLCETNGGNHNGFILFKIGKSSTPELLSHIETLEGARPFVSGDEKYLIINF